MAKAGEEGGEHFLRGTVDTDSTSNQTIYKNRKNKTPGTILNTLIK